jgi:hypothetical protein
VGGEKVEEVEEMEEEEGGTDEGLEAGEGVQGWWERSSAADAAKMVSGVNPDARTSRASEATDEAGSTRGGDHARTWMSSPDWTRARS